MGITWWHFALMKPLSTFFNPCRNARAPIKMWLPESLTSPSRICLRLSFLESSILMALLPLLFIINILFSSWISSRFIWCKSCSSALFSRFPNFSAAQARAEDGPALSIPSSILRLIVTILPSSRQRRPLLCAAVALLINSYIWSPRKGFDLECRSGAEISGCQGSNAPARV